MSQQRIAQALAITVMTLALGACAHHDTATQRSAAEYSDDTSINTNVQAAVLGVPGVHANDIQVSTYEGVVKLRGMVDNQKAAQNAIQAARQVEGVKTVDYDMSVKSSY